MWISERRAARPSRANPTLRLRTAVQVAAQSLVVSPLPSRWMRTRAAARPLRGARVHERRCRGCTQAAAGCAAMLTACAYGLSDWAFVAHSDVGLGLFARTPLQPGQFVVEFGGPFLSLECITKGEYVLEFPSGSDAAGLAMDGAHENSPMRAAELPSPAIFANHSNSPNMAVQYWPSTDRAPERLVLVATEAVAAGHELRFDYEKGGLHGQYWGRRVRPCVPVARKWHHRRMPPPPPSGEWPVVRYLPRLLEQRRRLMSSPEAAALDERQRAGLTSLGCVASATAATSAAAPASPRSVVRRAPACAHRTAPAHGVAA